MEGEKEGRWVVVVGRDFGREKASYYELFLLCYSFLLGEYDYVVCSNVIFVGLWFKVFFFPFLLVAN